MMYTHDLRTVCLIERMVRRPVRITDASYHQAVARRYECINALKYPPQSRGLGQETRDAFVEALRLDTQAGCRDDVHQEEDPITFYVESVKTDRAKTYAWFYALVIDPLVYNPFDERCTGTYVDALRDANPEALSALVRHFEITSRYFNHAEVERCVNELRVALQYLFV